MLQIILLGARNQTLGLMHVKQASCYWAGFQMPITWDFKMLFQGKYGKQW